MFGEGIGVFDGIDDHGVGVFAPDIACVHEIGHEPVLCPSSRRAGLRQRLGSSMSSQSLSVGLAPPRSSPRGEGTASEGLQADAVTSGGRLFCPRGSDEVSEVATDEGILFKHLTDFDEALACLARVTTDDEDEFFGLPFP